jgi:hypothetical protein
MKRTVAEYQGYLSELSRQLSAAGAEATIILFGGGALAFEYGARNETRDLDVLIKGAGAGALRLFASRVSALYGVEGDWINDDGVKFVTKEIQAASKVYWRLPGLTILTPPTDALLAMKVLAMRIDPYHPNKDDIIFLIQKLELFDEDAILGLVEKYLPEFSDQIDDGKRLWLRNLIQLARQ